MNATGPKPDYGLMFIALGLSTLGLLMFLHGIGVFSAEWLRPNPLTPHWVFSFIGVMLVLGGVLAAMRSVSSNSKFVNMVGWSFMILALIMGHWLVFFAEGASCQIESGGLFLNVGRYVCIGVAGIVLGLFDLILLATVIASIFRKLRS